MEIPLLAARVGADGVQIDKELVIDRDAEPTTQACLLGQASTVAVAWSGVNEDGTRGRTVVASILDAAPTPPLVIDDVSGLNSSVALASSGASVGVAWVRDVTGIGTGRVAIARANSRRVELPARPIAPEDPTAVSVVMASDGTDFGVVWNDLRHGALDLYFARVSANGALLLSPVRLTRESRLAIDPTLVWNGTEFALAWLDASRTGLEIRFARISRDAVRVGDDRRIARVSMPTGD